MSTKIVIEVWYTPGHSGVYGGGPDSWEPPEPPELEFEKVTVAGMQVSKSALDEIESRMDYEELCDLCDTALRDYHGLEDVC